MADDNLDSSTSSEASDVDILSEGANDEAAVEETSEVPEGESKDNESESGDGEESTDEESTEEDSEREETEEEPEESESEDDKLITRPSWKEITEKYPEIAKNKDFREMYHREREYSDLFPTVADARTAAEKVSVFDSFDDKISEGDAKFLFESLNPEVLSRFAKNVLPALYNVSEESFRDAVNPFLITVLHNVKSVAERNGDKNLRLSLQHISRAIFGKIDLPDLPSGKVDPDVKRLEDQIKTERDARLNADHRSFMDSADKSIKRQLNEVLLQGLDPKGEMSDFTKNAIIKETIEEMHQVLDSDKAFKSKLQNLIRAARNANYSSEYKPRVISAYLGRAKQVALGLRAKHKAAANGRRGTVRDKNRIESTSKNPTPQNGRDKSGKVDYRKMSDLDIINSR